ncbi:hypothetical protein BOX15_Mlig018547g2 [Macrostomum lignano]|uniref:Uncharacterized protein n=2 Tax=Macrostomum lignano TaxID=282301 RepID=A0A267FLN9_9PLAT|nr:hypothetical protein BOX15_Mlig018547g2 [Macrostomum lignano]
MEGIQNPTDLTDAGTQNGNAKHYQDIFIGCLLAVIGNLLISVSLNIQKYTHNRDQQLTVGNRTHYLKRPLWWVGIVLMVLGELGNFAAYGYAPASTVAPLGTTTVIANMFIAVLFLRERLRPEDLFGSSLSIVGAFLIVSFSKRKEHVLSSSQLVEALTSVRFIIYVSLELLTLTVLFFLLYVAKKDNVLILLLITSIVASFTVICAKAVSGLLNLSLAGLPQFGHPVLYIMTAVLVATAVLQVYYLNMAMKGSDSTVVVPTNFVFFTISAILSGIVFFNEFWGLHGLSIFMFLLGCLLSFVGVYFITLNRGSRSNDAAAEVLDDTVPIKSSAPLGGGEMRQVQFDVFPTWLFASVHRAEVQPRRSHPQWTGPPCAEGDDNERQRQQQPAGANEEDKQQLLPD